MQILLEFLPTQWKQQATMGHFQVTYYAMPEKIEEKNMHI